MPFCSKCGFRVEEEDNFCFRCGDEIKFRSKLDDEPEWYSESKNKKSSFWSIMIQSLKHTFFDNDLKLSKKRKIVNGVILAAILILAVSIVAPYLDSISLSIGNSIIQDGECKYRLDARKVYISEVSFIEDNMTMEIHITNQKDEDVVIETLAKTYEFRFDNKGETETEIVSMSIPSGKTLKLSFSVSKEPYLIGLELSNCEKLKITDWNIV
ncbi:hypothetical protein ACFLTH_07370 [Bacteroidota bacterium]